jgi:hypothetical protein
MTNPHGLAKDGNYLFICDGKSGLKLFDASVPTSPKLVKTVSGIETFDVIAFGGLAIVVAKDGLYQFSYSTRDNVTQLSKLSIKNNK